jgi:uncharacterized protein
MSEAAQMKPSGMIGLGLSLAIGLILGGWVLGSEIKAIRLGDRYVSVRGLAERSVKSDLAVWLLEYTEAGDDLPSLYSKTEADRKSILRFLTQRGIESSEIESGVASVLDNQANQFGAGNHPAHRYIVAQQITVMTSRVDRVAAAAQQTIGLLQEGIVLNGGPGKGVTYRFTGLNTIKPDMITEATKNARAAAERFALDAGSRVGSIRQARQGVFSILAANSGDTGENEEGGGYNSDADSSLMKTVRVVTTVDYYLEK